MTEVPELKERHVGSLQGLYWKEGAEKEPEAYSAFFSSQNDLEIPVSFIHTRIVSLLSHIFTCLTISYILYAIINREEERALTNFVRGL